MKQSVKTDKICVEKVIKYVEDIRDCFEHFNIKSHKDLKEKRLSQFAITQIITNIYEIKKNITEEMLSKLPEFDKIKIAGARNIASHDYEQVNFRMIFDICDMLLSEKVTDELNGVIEHASDNNQ